MILLLNAREFFVPYTWFHHQIHVIFPWHARDFVAHTRFHCCMQVVVSSMERFSTFACAQIRQKYCTSALFNKEFQWVNKKHTFILVCVCVFVCVRVCVCVCVCVCPPVNLSMSLWDLLTGHSVLARQGAATQAHRYRRVPCRVCVCFACACVCVHVLVCLCDAWGVYECFDNVW